MPGCAPSAFDWGDLSIDDVAVPLRVVTGDQSAALYAFGTPEDDVAYVNIGTGAFFQRAAGGRPLLIPGLLNSVVWQEGDDARYVVEGTVNGAAAALHAFAAELDIADVHALVQDAVTGPPDPAGVPLFLNGIGGLAAPFWLSDFASEFVGDGTLRGRTLAVLESIAFLLAVNLEQAERRLPAAARVVVSGGLASVDALCQALADVTGKPVERPREEEATSRGLTYLVAGMPAHWPAPPPARSFTPDAAAAVRDRYAAWRAALADRGATLPPPRP